MVGGVLPPGSGSRVGVGPFGRLLVQPLWGRVVWPFLYDSLLQATGSSDLRPGSLWSQERFRCRVSLPTWLLRDSTIDWGGL